ncbi:MAG: transposase [Arenicellales bacterium]
MVLVGQGKGSETIDRFLHDTCPDATLVLDRFHLVKAPKEAVDEVRKQQWREACLADR